MLVAQLPLLPLLLLLSGPLTFPAPDPCTLVTPAEVTAALDASPAAAHREGPDEKRELGGTSTSCSRQVGQWFLRFDLVEFGNAAAAAKTMNAVVTQSQRDATGLRLSSISGVGERAFSAAGDEGAL